MTTKDESPEPNTLREILVQARALVEDDYSVRDAVYESAVNGESDSAAILALQRAGLRSEFSVMPKIQVLAIFDKAIADESPVEFHVGDRVRAKRDMYEGPTGELPAQDLCRKGDLLIIRRVGGFWPYSVSHPEITDRTFGVTADDIEPALPIEKPIDFSCRVCGAECTIAPDLPARAVCPAHCEDHDFQHDASRRGKFCIHCDEPEPDDWR